MTRLGPNTRVIRETGAVLHRRPVIVELHSLTLRIRLKGARWGYEVDYESIFQLGAKKRAEQERNVRGSGRKGRRTT